MTSDSQADAQRRMGREIVGGGSNNNRMGMRKKGE